MKNFLHQLFSEVIVFAQTATSTTATTTDSPIFNLPQAIPPSQLIDQIYRFGLGVGAFLAFAWIVYSGFIYAWGGDNPSVRSDARDRITQALLGLLLLIGATALLNIINSRLTNLTDPILIGVRPPPPLPASEYIGDLPAGRCEPVPGGPGSVESLSQTCFGNNADMASRIVKEESGGNPALPSGVDICKANGTNDPVSWGLFQINLTVHPLGSLNCPQAFNRPYNGARSTNICYVRDRDLYNRCVEAAKDPQVNIQRACQISRNGLRWDQWGANRICRF